MAKAKFSPPYQLLLQLLVTARKKTGLRQEDVAHLLKQGQSYVSKVETGERRLDVVEFVRFADAVDVDPLEVLRKVIRAARK